MTILETESSKPAPYIFKDSLEKLTFTLEEMRLKKTNQKIEMIKKMGKQEHLFIWEQAFLATAHWFSGFPEFNELKMDVKIEILKSAWLLWIRLEKLSETANFHRQRILGDDVFICGEGKCLSINDFEMDLKWLTNYSMEQMAFYLMPDKNWKQCINDLHDMQPTTTELTFMLVQLCLYEAGKKFQGEILEVTDRLLQIQANNLHEYYVKKMKIPNYSARLTRLMKVNRAIEVDMRERRERNHIAKLFNIYSIDFSHPEMFELA